MQPVGRREFIRGAAASAAAYAIGRCVPAVRAQTADSRLEILVDEPIGTIAPELYGHFAEHLGGVIYDGIWVGPESKVPNIDGIRRTLVDHVRRLGRVVVRWPGADVLHGFPGSRRVSSRSALVFVFRVANRDRAAGAAGSSRPPVARGC